MITIVGSFLLLILVPLTSLILYQWFLAICSLSYRQPQRQAEVALSRFLVMIPAHDEELGIASTLESLRQLDYPRDRYTILVIADRCTDGTAAVARAQGAECFERFDGRPGKGAALAWGIQEAQKAKIEFEAVVIVDADTLVDRSLLSAFNRKLQAGYKVQQGYNYISNPWASPFTRIIAVTGVLRNGRYYAGKTALGLPGMLTGTGMCLGVDVLNQHGWTAFSVGEDWELSVELLLHGEHIYFNPAAKTFAKESQNLQQASHQRLRWASGRYAVMGGKAWALIRQGLRSGSFSLIDSAVTLMAPNYSTQASLALVSLAGGWVALGYPGWEYLFYWAATLLAVIAGYFMLGVFSTDAPARALAGLLLVPLFLPWRLAIEILGLVGYGRGHWGRMSRATVTSHHTDH
ncbi:MAG TPA: glycosyltransferase family 2 protein [Nitrospira sp.]|nr:glycosyltransferase family 2 protein [Nitrospira sp.]